MEYIAVLVNLFLHVEHRICEVSNSLFWVPGLGWVLREFLNRMKNEDANF